MYEIGNGEANRRFSGKRSDYPMFRQQLLRDYSLLWESEPYSLLQKIANSVTDAVYEHIKSAWVMRNPQEALDHIWEILEDLCGDPRKLLENAIQEIKWQRGSLLSKVSALQCYRTKLRNLESVASSISMAAELSRPKLLFRIVDCFNPPLQAQIAQEYRDCRQWTFEVVLEFINRQICNLQFRESHSYNISAIIDEDETSKAYRKSYFERKQTRARANNLQVAIKETNRSIPKNDAHNVVSQNLRKACNESNCVVHPLVQHKTIDCRQFLNKTIKERQELVRAHDLCYYCLQKHYARSCTNKKRCEKCQGAHSPMLHLEVNAQRESHSRKAAHTSMADREVMSESLMHSSGHINTARTNKKREVKNSECNASVPLIASTAVTNDADEQAADIPFCALVDTGAHTNLCTRELTEKLFG